MGPFMDLHGGLILMAAFFLLVVVPLVSARVAGFNQLGEDE